MMETREMSVLLRQVSEAQRLDHHYAQVARDGYDPTTGERGPVLQSYAAKRSRQQTRARLFPVIEAAV